MRIDAGTLENPPRQVLGALGGTSGVLGDP